MKKVFCQNCGENVEQQVENPEKRRARVIFSRFRVAQTSGRVYPKQNLIRKQILTSKNQKSGQNQPKITKNWKKIAKKIRKKNFFSIFFFDSESFETRFGEVWRVKNCEKRVKNSKKIAKILAKIREISSLVEKLAEISLSLD